MLNAFAGMPIACSVHATVIAMSSVQVKHLDDETHEALRVRAAANGRSISDYVLELIRKDLRKPSRAAWLEHVRTLSPIPTTTADIVRIRENGHRG